MPPRRKLTPQQIRWRSMSERQFQQWVMDLARACGWRVWHFNDSRRQVKPGVWVGDADAAGFPDLVLAHPRWGVIFRELKAEGEKPTPKQEQALADLRAAAADAKVWWPHDEEEICLRLTRASVEPLNKLSPRVDSI